MSAVLELIPTTGVEFACQGLGVSRASFYRRYPIEGPATAALSQASASASGVEQSPTAIQETAQPPRSFRALSREEEQIALDCLHSPRFQDCAPAAIVAMLLDEGIYH